jgi:hypothetical protein
MLEGYKFHPDWTENTLSLELYRLKGTNHIDNENPITSVSIGRPPRMGINGTRTPKHTSHAAAQIDSIYVRHLNTTL